MLLFFIFTVIDMTVGQKIGILRNSMGLSQEQLAERLEVSRQSVSKWESDTSMPEIGKIIQLSTLFNISIDDLIREEIPLEPSFTENLFKQKDSFSFNGKYFGTDGFRGEANRELTAYHAFKIGRFLGWYYKNNISAKQNRRARIVIGKDTRRSSYMLEYAMVSGVTASGADAYMLHVTTTPSVSYVVRQDGFDCGVMISASHNSYSDNGIKLLNRAGEKMDDYTLSLIEKYIDGDLSEFDVEGEDLPLAYKDGIGQVIDHVAGRNRYVGYLISIAANSYRNISVAIDCANGASWMIAPAVFSALGADVHIIDASPNGLNINENSGSTHINSLRKYVKENHIDVGFAFDGDADRLIAVDENGNVINGDRIIYVIAKRLLDKGLLPGNKVVTNIASNVGLYKALEAMGIGWIQTDVGDRNVHDAMLQNNLYLGGEQTGHIIIRKYSTTGDGILSAIMLLEEMADKKATLGQLAEPVNMYPQAIKNITVTDKSAVANNERVKAEISDIANELKNNGRIFMRESGTEPIVRIMVEAGSQKLCDALTDRVEKIIEQLGYCK